MWFVYVLSVQQHMSLSVKLTHWFRYADSVISIYIIIFQTNLSRQRVYFIKVLSGYKVD